MIPLVSVIIPFYNRVDWLIEAVQSVLDQTYTNFEIIVINDGSKEDLSKFLSAYGDKIIYKFKQNGGAASARNFALKIAKGDYIAFLDSDDIWMPNKTEKQIEFMKQRNAMWSHTGFVYWDYVKNKTTYVDNFNDYNDVYLKYFISVRIATPSVIINKKVFIEFPDLKFPEFLRIGEDSLFYQRLNSYYPLFLINESLLKVRLRGNNSNTRALPRFTFKIRQYNFMNSFNTNYKITPTVKLINSIYLFYIRIFGSYEVEGPKNKELMAKIFWILPYSIERIYLQYLNLKNVKEDKEYFVQFKNTSVPLKM